MKSWTHPNYPKRTYFGSYRYVDGKRGFVLSWIGDTRINPHEFYFDSWQSALVNGWVKE